MSAGSMDFGAALQELVGAVDGALGAVLVGRDGLTVDQAAGGDGFDATLAGAEYASVANQIQKASRGFGLGRGVEAMVTGEKAVLLLATVGDEYVAALAMRPEGNLGRGRLELRRQAARFTQALS